MKCNCKFTYQLTRPAAHITYQKYYDIQYEYVFSLMQNNVYYLHPMLCGEEEGTEGWCRMRVILVPSVLNVLTVLWDIDHCRYASQLIFKKATRYGKAGDHGVYG